MSWIHSHAYRDAAIRYDTLENYTAQAFERFWMATAYSQKLEFSSLTAALKYLHISLNCDSGYYAFLLKAQGVASA
jgi:hypothetical protein